LTVKETAPGIRKISRANQRLGRLRVSGLCDLLSLGLAQLCRWRA
jgi:hypothetical protein